MNIIQIGCHDGDDEVFQFVTENKGQINRLILVEPIQEKVKQLKERYSNYPNAEIFEAAITGEGEKESSVEMFTPREDDRKQVTSINKNHVISFSEQIDTFTVRA